ncbi:rhodanese-like domain-containing protein [Spirosoma sp. SC4-14]|uniref:rhodanese-like domain-containing protein n=1 Tax=Spirosoma sp. SC4-14 TaxID=3128900 RepID=UPI0030CF7E12
MRIFLTILFLSPLLWNCGSHESTIHHLSPADFKTTLANTTPHQLIDLRTDQEVGQGVIGDAHQIDIYKSDFEEQISKLNKNQPVFLYCAVGGRSAQAAKYLSEQGFARIYNLTNGIRSWIEAGNPINPIHQ